MKRTPGKRNPTLTTREPSPSAQPGMLTTLRAAQAPDEHLVGEDEVLAACCLSNKVIGVVLSAARRGLAVL